MTTDEIQASAARLSRECFALKTRYMSRVATHLYNKALRPGDISVNQLHILAAILELEDPTPSALTSLLCMDKSTLSRNLKRMEQHGWIAMAPREDRRYLSLSLTEEGITCFSSCMEAWQSVQSEFRDRLGMDGVVAIHLVHQAVQSIPGGEEEE